MMTVLFQLSLLADGTPNLLASLLETSSYSKKITYYQNCLATDRPCEFVLNV